MWIVIKYKKNEYELFKSELNRKLKKIKIYCPKLVYEKKNKFHLSNILEDYLFCFHKDFEMKEILSKLKYLKGMSYILSASLFNQKNIAEFIDFLKKNEWKKGYLLINFFFKLSISKVKFLNGPFSNLVFEILEKNKKYIKCSLGNMSVRFNKNSYLSYRPSF